MQLYNFTPALSCSLWHLMISGGERPPGNRSKHLFPKQLCCKGLSFHLRLVTVLAISKSVARARRGSSPLCWLLPCRFQNPWPARARRGSSPLCWLLLCRFQNPSPHQVKFHNSRTLTLISWPIRFSYHLVHKHIVPLIYNSS